MDIYCANVKKAKEEVEALEKKMQQLEHELTQTQTNLDQATHNLEEKEKALQNVSLMTNNVFYRIMHGNKNSFGIKANASYLFITVKLQHSSNFSHLEVS